MRVGEAKDDRRPAVLSPQPVDQLFVSFRFTVYAPPETLSLASRRPSRSSPAKPYARRTGKGKKRDMKRKPEDEQGQESDGSSIVVLDRPTSASRSVAGLRHLVPATSCKMPRSRVLPSRCLYLVPYHPRGCRPVPQRCPLQHYRSHSPI